MEQIKLFGCTELFPNSLSGSSLPPKGWVDARKELDSKNKIHPYCLPAWKMKNLTVDEWQIRIGLALKGMTHLSRNEKLTIRMTAEKCLRGVTVYMLQMLHLAATNKGTLSDVVNAHLVAHSMMPACKSLLEQLGDDISKCRPTNRFIAEVDFLRKELVSKTYH